MEITRYDSLLSMDTDIESKDVAQRVKVIKNHDDNEEETRFIYSSLFLSNLDKGVLDKIEGDYTIYYDVAETRIMAKITLDQYKVHGKLYKYTYEGGLIYVATYDHGILKDIEMMTGGQTVLASTYDKLNTTIIAKNNLLYNAVLYDRKIASININREDNLQKFVEIIYDVDSVKNLDYYKEGNVLFLHSIKENGIRKELTVTAINTSIITYTLDNGIKTGGGISNFLFNSDLEFEHNGSFVTKIGK